MGRLQGTEGYPWKSLTSLPHSHFTGAKRGAMIAPNHQQVGGQAPDLCPAPQGGGGWCHALQVPGLPHPGPGLWSFSFCTHSPPSPRSHGWWLVPNTAHQAATYLKGKRPGAAWGAGAGWDEAVLSEDLGYADLAEVWPRGQAPG